MDLLCNIKNDRAQLRRRQPLERKAFNVVSCIVKQYNLGESFLELLDQTEYLPPRENMEFNGIRSKEMLESPPFCMLFEHEYRIVVSITGRLDNPYLQYAHSPEELLLCAPLYKTNPMLNSERLSRYHFETLLRCEHCRVELARLEMDSDNFEEKVNKDSRVRELNVESSPWTSFQGRISQLRTFITRVDNMES